MPTSRILNRYILSEILTPFLISLFVFTGILFLARILRLFDLIINKSVPIGDTLLLFSYVIPRFLEFTVPMALLIAVISAFGRLSSDSELLVMRASGISFKQLAVPVVIFSTASLVISLAIALWLRPWANLQLGKGLFEIAKMRASASMIPGVFNDLGRLTIYAEKIKGNGKQLENIAISDERIPEQTTVFIAKHGSIVSDDIKRTLTLRLYDGSIHTGSGLKYNLTYFDINNISLDERELLEDDIAKKGKKRSEMYLPELVHSIDSLKRKPRPLSNEDILQLAKDKVEWHSRFVVPFACLCIAFVAMALGVQPSRSGEKWGGAANVTAGLIVIMIYYVFLGFVNAVAKKAVEPTWFFMWLPNICFALLAYYLFRIMQKERWLTLTQAIGHTFTYAVKRLKLFG